MATQLQHAPPSAFPFSSSAARPGARYTSPPSSADPALASGAVHVSNNSISSQNTNPFRTPKHSPHTSASSTSFVFSPVSPIEEERTATVPPLPNPRPSTLSQPRIMAQEPRRSVDLRTIDGKPYPGRQAESDAKSRKVKVAQDMYAGELPPGYERQDYKAPGVDEKGHKHTDSCHKCGGHKKVQSLTSSPTEKPPMQPQNIDCSKCGGKRSTPPSSFPGAAMANIRPPPQSTGPMAESSEAGPSTAPPAHKHKCTKCGRRKRPESMSASGSSSQSHSPQQASYRNIPVIQTNGMPVNINIEPPTAITERAPTLPFSPASTIGETPLINGQQKEHKKGHKPSRSGSISSLFRSLSRRKKSMDHSSPTQPTPTEGHQSSGRSSASHSRLRPDEHIDRPGSPFSFVDKPQEEQAFEMNDMRRSKLPDRRDSWDKADESTVFLGSQTQRPRIGRSQSTNTAKYPSDSTQPVDDVYLSLPPDQRPGITRFKSLRQGVNRAADGLSRSASQISRSSSLRRLGSVKKVPQLWYRDDMTLEGASSEYDRYGY